MLGVELSFQLVVFVVIVELLAEVLELEYCAGLGAKSDYWIYCLVL